MKFLKEDLQALVWEDYDDTIWGVTEVNLVESSRWSLIYEMIFQYDGKFYKTSYSRGATECQDERPYEYDSDVIECAEVQPVQVTVTKWKEV